jgi:hypothetical protein
MKTPDLVRGYPTMPRFSHDEPQGGAHLRRLVNAQSEVRRRRRLRDTPAFPEDLATSQQLVVFLPSRGRVKSLQTGTMPS